MHPQYHAMSISFVRSPFVCEDLQSFVYINAQPVSSQLSLMYILFFFFVHMKMMMIWKILYYKLWILKWWRSKSQELSKKYFLICENASFFKLIKRLLPLCIWHRILLFSNFFNLSVNICLKSRLQGITLLSLSISEFREIKNAIKYHHSKFNNISTTSHQRTRGI